MRHGAFSGRACLASLVLAIWVAGCGGSSRQGAAPPGRDPPAPGPAREAPDAITPDAMLRQASNLAEKGDFAAALRQVDRVLKARPNDAAALMARGRILLMDGRAKEAEPSLRKVVESEPANSAARLMLGYSCLDQGRHAEAEALLRKVAEADGPIRLRVSAYLGLALAYDRMGRKDAVGRCYDEALALDESVADILLKVERQAFMPGPIPDSRDKPRLRGGLGQAEVNRIVKEVAREKP